MTAPLKKQVTTGNNPTPIKLLLKTPIKGKYLFKVSNKDINKIRVEVVLMSLVFRVDLVEKTQIFVFRTLQVNVKYCDLGDCEVIFI